MKAGGHVAEQMTVGRFIKTNIPGGWNHVISWLNDKKQGISVENMRLKLSFEIRGLWTNQASSPKI
jgi:hypothetical protein